MSTIELRRADRSAVYRAVAVNEGNAKQTLSNKGGYRSMQRKGMGCKRCGQRRVVYVAVKRKQRRSDTQPDRYVTSRYEQIQGYRQQR